MHNTSLLKEFDGNYHLDLTKINLPMLSNHYFNNYRVHEVFSLDCVTVLAVDPFAECPDSNRSNNIVMRRHNLQSEQ